MVLEAFLGQRETMWYLFVESSFAIAVSLTAL